MSSAKKGARRAGAMVGIIFYLFFAVLPAAGQVEGFLGRWALYLPSGAGWLEVRQEENYLDADIMWVAGSVVGVVLGAKLMMRLPARELRWLFGTFAVAVGILMFLGT